MPRTLLLILILTTFLVPINSFQIRPKFPYSSKHFNNTVPENLESNIFTMLDTMFQSNGLSPSIHIQNCLSLNQDITLFALVRNLISRGYEMSFSYVDRFIPFFFGIVSESLSEDTFQCLKNSNDIALLKRQYGIKEGFEKIFGDFGNKNFTDLHMMFANIIEAFGQQNYPKVGQLLDQYGHTIFGYKIVDDQWVVRAEAVQKMNEYYGVTVSNGIIGAVSVKYPPFKLSETVMGGVYEKQGRGRVQNIFTAFPILNLDLQNCGRNQYNIVQQLYLKEGKMKVSYSTDLCSINYEYMAVKTLPFTFLTKITVKSHKDYDSQVITKNIQNAPEHLNNLQKSYENIETGSNLFTIMHSKASTKSGKIDIAIASSYLFQGTDSADQMLHQDYDTDSHIHIMKKKLNKFSQFTYGIISSLITTEHHSDPENEAARSVIRGVSLGMEKIIQQHTAQWKNLWENDIIIQGNQEDQKNIRLMLYHFYAFTNPFKSYGLSPMGLSGLGYNGHVFWDMDLWMYPAILALKPEMARTLVQYRIDRLEAAKNNAFINGYKGAMYPWESGRQGDEQTPIWALTGPLQHHVTGCVSFAIWNYYCVTQDLDWLRRFGQEVIDQVAEFWESRVQFDDSDGLYHINNVVGADQWAENVDDNAFTNGIAKKSFQIANKARKLLGLQQNKKWQQILKSIAFYQFPDSKVTKEYRSYSGINIKQADVNLLAFPLNLITDPDQILRDIQFYEKKVPNQGTPAMTSSIFTILYSRLKKADKAYQIFLDSHRPNLRPPFKVFAETKDSSNPYFITGAGGVLQSVIFGFGGYSITDHGLQKIQTAKPSQWTKLTIKGFLKSKN